MDIASSRDRRVECRALDLMRLHRPQGLTTHPYTMLLHAAAAKRGDHCGAGETAQQTNLERVEFFKSLTETQASQMTRVIPRCLARAHELSVALNKA